VAFATTDYIAVCSACKLLFTNTGNCIDESTGTYSHVRRIKWANGLKAPIPHSHAGHGSAFSSVENRTITYKIIFSNINYTHTEYDSDSRWIPVSLQYVFLREDCFFVNCSFPKKQHLSLIFTYCWKKIKCTVGHKSHAFCFHVFPMDAGVMTFVTHCTAIYI